ncbi:MAG: hypothetical protein PVG18_08475 [Thioalkalispiraceae bacterium]|jgi:hypothetical protein
MYKRIMLGGLLLAMSWSTAALAEMDALSKADQAVAIILFEYEGADEFATYRVNDDGFVDIVFARNMPDSVYSDLLGKLQNNPDINGVLAGRGGPACNISSWKAESAELKASE